MSATTQTAPASNAEWLLEGTEPGLPLIISFGFYYADGNPLFDFYGRLKKIALVSGRAANHLFVRDLSQRWYLRGIASLGADVDSTVAALREIIAPLAPSSITTMGQSMGAYGAILYGTLLGVDRMITFGPLSCFDGPRWELMKDSRWKPIRENLVATGPQIAPYDDLAGLLRNLRGKRPALDIFYGMVGDDHLPTHLNIGHDVAHAMRFEGIDKITLLPVPMSAHAVVEYFRQHGVITDVLLNRLYGTPLTACIARLYEPPLNWVGWLEENIARGCNVADLTQTLRDHHMEEDVIRTMFERVHVIRCLRVIDSRPSPPLLMKAPYDPDEEEELAACCSDPSHQHR